MSTSKTAGKVASLDSFKRFLRDVKVELSKVIWPGREEVVSSTVVVLAAVAFFSLFIGLIDLFFVAMIRLISA